MGLLKRWRQARHARCDAKAYLRKSGLADRLPALQQAELLRLRSAFSQGKMGQWSERATLYVRASRLPANACIVEIGSWVGVGRVTWPPDYGREVEAVCTPWTRSGGSTLDARSQPAWAASVAKMGGSTLPLFRAHVRRFGLETLVTPIEADSAAAAAVYDGPPIDLLFIDGDHVDEAVRADFEAWWPKVRPGGLVMFHDYNERHPGVRRFVDEALMGPLRGFATERVSGLLSVPLLRRAENLG